MSPEALRAVLPAWMHNVRPSAGAGYRFRRGAPPSRRARAASLAERMGLGALLRAAPLWRGVAVLGYHRIGNAWECAADRSVFSATVDDFDSHLDLLARSFEVIRPADLETALSQRSGRAVLITFDDGYSDQAELAAPLMNAHGLSGAFFLTTGFIDRRGLAWWDELSWMARNSARERLPADDRWLPNPLALGRSDREHAALELHQRFRELPAAVGADFLNHVAEASGCGRPDASIATWMTWNDARRLQQQGHAIGGHSVTHPILSGLSADDQRAEVDGCLERLRTELDTPIESFAYPSGHPGSFDETTMALLREAGIRWAFSFRGGWERPGRSNPLDLRRIGVKWDHPTALVAARVSVPRLLASEMR